MIPVKYNYRNLVVRKTTTIAAAFGLALVVFVFAAAQMLGNGITKTLGRTASADLPIVSDQISRRHAEIYALEGEYWACDLGSTNVTKVNGQPLASAPRKLQAGDIVLVGDVELLYEEHPKP